jgi:hypothetical protein
MRLRLLHLGERRRFRHDDEGGDAEAPRMKSDALRVIAR